MLPMGHLRSVGKLFVQVSINPRVKTYRSFATSTFCQLAFTAVRIRPPSKREIILSDEILIHDDAAFRLMLQSMVGGNRT